MKKEYNSLGYYTYESYLDWKGNPIKRTPNDYIYSYDAYVVHKKQENYNNTVYSDRLYQWDWDKYNELCEKHFGNQGQYWDNRNVEDIERFLRDYYDKPKLELVGIMKGCNVSNGYPYWIFMFNCKFD